MAESPSAVIDAESFWAEPEVEATVEVRIADRELVELGAGFSGGGSCGCPHCPAARTAENPATKIVRTTPPITFPVASTETSSHQPFQVLFGVLGRFGFGTPSAASSADFGAS